MFISIELAKEEKQLKLLLNNEPTSSNKRTTGHNGDVALAVIARITSDYYNEIRIYRSCMRGRRWNTISQLPLKTTTWFKLGLRANCIDKSYNLFINIIYSGILGLKHF